MKKYFSIIFLLFLNVNLIFGFQYESSIVKIDGADIYINWGSNDGIESGIVFNAYRMTGMSHPATDEKMEIERDLVGSIMITDIFPEYSIGKFISRQKEPKVGDYLELVVKFNDKKFISPREKGIIIGVDKGKVEINVGQDDGIQEGLLFDVMSEEELIHPVTGEPLDTKSILIGKVSIEAVKKATSVGNIISGWEDIKVGDNIILSEAQKSDMGIDILTGEKEKGVSDGSGISGTELRKLFVPAERKDFLGKIVNVNNKAKKAVFSFEEDFDKRSFKRGSNFGIYRKERILHPITKVEMGSPEVLIGVGSFNRMIGENGVLDILSMEANINKGDIVKLREEPAELPGPRRTAKLTIGKKIDLRDEAEFLTQEIIQIQEDIDKLKTFSHRIGNIEKSLSSQKRITSSIRKDIKDIKGKLNMLIEGGAGSLIPSQTTMELYGAYPGKAKSFRINYAEGIDVKVQYQDKVIWVSLDVDSGKVKTKVADSEQKEAFKKEQVELTEDEEVLPLSELLGETPEKGKPFYLKYLLPVLGGIGGLGILFLAFYLFKMKGKGKKPAGEGEDEFEKAEEKIEEVEEEEEEEEDF